MTIDARQFERKYTYVGPSPVTSVRDNTDVVISNTTSETALFTYTIPAGTLDGDHGVRVTIRGERVNVSGGTVIYTIRIKLGSTTIWEDSEGFINSSAQAPLLIEIELYAKNSDAIQEMDGRVSISQSVSPSTGLGGITSGGAVDAIIHGESTEDGTTDLDLVVTVEMDTADPAAIVTHRKSLVELL